MAHGRVDPVRALEGFRARVAVVMVSLECALAFHCRCCPRMRHAHGHLEGVHQESAAMGRDRDISRRPGLDTNPGPRPAYPGTPGFPAVHAAGLGLARRSLKARPSRGAGSNLTSAGGSNARSPK